MTSTHESSPLRKLEESGVYIDYALGLEARYLQCQAAAHHILTGIGIDRLEEARGLEHEAVNTTSPALWNAARQAMQDQIEAISQIPGPDVPSKPDSVTTQIWEKLLRFLKGQADGDYVAEDFIKWAADNGSRYTMFLKDNARIVEETRAEIPFYTIRDLSWTTEKGTPGVKILDRKTGRECSRQAVVFNDTRKAFRGLIRSRPGGKKSPFEYKYHNGEQQGSERGAAIQRRIAWHLAVNL